MSTQTTNNRQPANFMPAERVRNFGTTVFAEFTPLAIKHDAVNLGQGFPNFAAPDFIKEAAKQAIDAELNQYSLPAGHPRLNQAISRVYSPLFDRELNPATEIVVTVGATEGIFASIQAVVEPGDEVILIEPFYDSYPASVIMAGGTPVYLPLRFAENTTHASQWYLDMDELAAAITPRTKMLIINTPLNPIGKMYSREELTQIATLVQEHDLYVLSDEVYEWMSYTDDAGKPTEHVRIATLPGMWDRTITLGSAGKTFSVTGWKIGWAIAPEPIAHAIVMGHQWIPFTVATPLQDAVAAAMEHAAESSYFADLSTMYQNKRDKLLPVLNEVGLTPVQPDGSYFILVDTSQLDVPVAEGQLRDYELCRWLTTEVGVAAIPPSAFYSPEHQHLTANLARFCFCKTDEMLDEAARRLQKLG